MELGRTHRTISTNSKSSIHPPLLFPKPSLLSEIYTSLACNTESPRHSVGKFGEKKVFFFLGSATHTAK
jgi:hypothetical protein